MRRVNLLALALLSLAGCQSKVGVGHREPPPDGAEIQSPVTRERCRKGPETEAVVFEGKTYYFCSPGERQKFRSAPATYADR